MSSVPTLSLTGGRLIDPAQGLDQYTDLHLAAGRVLAVGPAPADFRPEQVLDAAGLVICPGFVDLSARLREPGEERTATIATETRAAASSGITTLCCPPDTLPVIDTPAVAQLIQRTAAHHGYARVVPVGALTQGLDGLTLSEMAALQAAGCPVLSQAGRPLRNAQVQRRALEYAATFGLSVFLYPQDPDLSAGGCAHEGVVSTRLGLPGIPEAAETVAVARDLALAEQTGARIHFRGLSTEKGVAMLTVARRRGLAVTADVAMHQLLLTEEDLLGFDANCHLMPPLRTRRDRDALRAALADGDLDAICSDHQPLDADAKRAPFPETAPGISALETLLPLALRLVTAGVLTLPRMIARLTSGPAAVLGRDIGSLAPGRTADLCVFDPAACWVPTAANLLSQGRHSPFLDQEMTGRVIWTILAGRPTFAHPTRPLPLDPVCGARP